MIEFIVLVMNQRQVMDYLGVDPGWGWWLVVDPVNIDSLIGEFLPWEKRMFF